MRSRRVVVLGIVFGLVLVGAGLVLFRQHPAGSQPPPAVESVPATGSLHGIAQTADQPLLRTNLDLPATAPDPVVGTGGLDTIGTQSTTPPLL